MTDRPKSQLDKFKEAARELECDDDERHFDERMKKLVSDSREKLAKSEKLLRETKPD